jgi:hypothetical protein
VIFSETARSGKRPDFPAHFNPAQAGRRPQSRIGRFFAMVNHRRARLVLETFLLVFMAARVVVYLIMSRRMPDLYLHVGGTHVHHLNYGIFLLSGVGAWLLFAEMTPRRLDVAAVVYGAGLALTFDEFGMWIHLGGAYWQRASFDAVCVIAALLGVIAFLPNVRQLTARQWARLLALVILAAGFGWMLQDSLQYAESRVGSHLRQLESDAPQ